MELPFEADLPLQLLPFDGEAVYHGKILDPEFSDTLFSTFSSSIAWRNEVIHMFGKVITLSRKVAWYGDRPYAYRYSGVTYHALPWTDALIRLKQHVEDVTGFSFNCCLMNYYHHGSEQMGWHCDDEKELLKDAPIASLSLGADRKFDFRHKTTKEKSSVRLEHGSLLVMKGVVQQYWEHRLPADKKIETARINLTFRTMDVKGD